MKLSAKWLLDAALLSRPVDLTPLVSLSRSDPNAFLEDNTLQRLVTTLLNESNDKKSSKETKLEVLNILANVALAQGKAANEVVNALQAVGEWFDSYLSEENSGDEPILHKAMVLLLARCWDYRLKTEDVLELTKGDRKIALCTVVGLLEDGETYSTELKQRQKPGQGKLGQWEHELVCHRYEKPLLLQICRLLRGFTHPGTYFSTQSEDILLYSVEKFASEIDKLLEITICSGLVEKLSIALYDCLFEDNDDSNDEKGEGRRNDFLEEFEHIAVSSVHAFLQNLYFYAVENTEEYRLHMLMDTLLIPRLVLPYLDRCVLHATVLNTRAEAFKDMLEGDLVAEMALHNPNLVKGMAASLRTLIIASFRAPSTQFVVTLLRRLNPTLQLLRASAFCRFHDYIFTLICILNINMGVLELNSADDEDESSSYASSILQALSVIFATMDSEKQNKVIKRLLNSGALPISRDTPSFNILMSVLLGGEAGQLNYNSHMIMSSTADFSKTLTDDNREFMSLREEAKRLHDERLAHLKKDNIVEQESEPRQSAFKIAVAIANSDAKDSKPSGGFRLLGDLPSLTNNNNKTNLDVQLQQPSKHKFMKNSDAKSSGLSLKIDPNIPKEFLCEINGHVMKEPVRNIKTNHVFERATINLWIKTRGLICPITNEDIDQNDLVPDEELRNKIKRYQIQQLAFNPSKSNNSADEDIYDF